MDVGLRGAPPRPRPTPTPPPAADTTQRTAAVLLCCLAALGAAAWLVRTGLAAAPAVSLGESSFAVRAFAINQFGYGAAALSWYDGGLAALQVAGYETISGALRRAPTAVVAAREATAVAALFAAAALTLAARRLRLSGPATVAVPVLFGLAPAAVLLHRTADPAQLGVLWACVALALAGGEARRTGAAIGSVAYLAAAAISSPLVLVALIPLFAALLFSGDVGRLRGAWRWLVSGAGALLWLALVALARRGDLAGGGSASPPQLTTLDLVLAVLAVAAGVAGLWVRWLRALALALLAVVITAGVAAGSRGSLLLVALPLAAVVLPAAADAAVTALSARLATARPRLRRLPAAAVGAAALAAVLAWAPAAGVLGGDTGAGPDAGDRGTVDSARAWVLDNLPSRPRLAVDDVVWAELVDAGYPAGQLASASGLGPANAAWPGGWTEASYVIGRDRVLLDPGTQETVRQARRSSTAVAAFGTGDDRVQVRRVRIGPGAAAGTVREAAGRVAAGTALATNPRLAPRPAAVALMRSGRVDARALSVLAAITDQHSLTVADFPVVPGEDPDRPRRLIAVSAIDGQPVRAGSTAVTLLDQWLRAQQPPFRPADTTLSEVDGQPALLIRYDALGTTDPLPP